MQKVVQYKCDYCEECFDSEDDCMNHEEAHKIYDRVNKMLSEGYTLSQINEQYNIWNEIPEYLKNVTKDYCFTIPYYSSGKPTYQICLIDTVGKLLKIRPCVQLNEYWGDYVTIGSPDLRNVHRPEELFVDRDLKKFYESINGRLNE